MARPVTDSFKRGIVYYLQKNILFESQKNGFEWASKNRCLHCSYSCKSAEQFARKCEYMIVIQLNYSSSAKSLRIENQIMEQSSRNSETYATNRSLWYCEKHLESQEDEI